jgi:hypothetical protein
MANNQVFFMRKTDHKRELRHDYSRYENNHFVIPDQVVNVFDLGYLCKKRISQNRYHNRLIFKRKRT